MYGTCDLVYMYGTCDLVYMYGTCDLVCMYGTCDLVYMYGTCDLVCMYGTCDLVYMYGTLVSGLPANPSSLNRPSQSLVSLRSTTAYIHLKTSMLFHITAVNNSC